MTSIIHNYVSAAVLLNKVENMTSNATCYRGEIELVNKFIINPKSVE